MIQISQVGKIWGKISPIRTALTQVIRELISPTHTYYLTTKTKIQPFHLLVGWCIINTVRKHHDHKRSVKPGIANQPLWLHLGWPSLHQLLLYVHYYMGHYHPLGKQASLGVRILSPSRVTVTINVISDALVWWHVPPNTTFPVNVKPVLFYAINETVLALTDGVADR